MQTPMAPILLLQLLIWTIAFTKPSYAASNPKRPSYSALFALGDSILDTGNNNFITTVIQSNHAPYGANFPGHLPTGRFSNGKLMSDFLVSSLGIKETLPPFLDPNLSPAELTTGVCFASAGSGYDETTSAVFNIIPVVKQLDLFENYVNKLKTIVGREETQRIVNGSLVLVSAGSNDHFVSYYDTGARKLQFPDINDYHDFLLSRMSSFVKGLYNLGARRMMIMGTPPLGCLPLQMALSLSPGSCVDYQNEDSMAFNAKLKEKLEFLEGSLPESKIAYVDIYQPLMEIVGSPQSLGMDDVSEGCCGTGYAEMAFLCSKISRTCNDPNRYLFFDSVHPSEAAYWYVFRYIEKNLLDPLHF